MNGRAELAANRGLIKGVRILQLNIPHSKNILKRAAIRIHTVPKIMRTGHFPSLAAISSHVCAE